MNLKTFIAVINRWYHHEELETIVNRIFSKGEKNLITCLHVFFKELQVCTSLPFNMRCIYRKIITRELRRMQLVISKDNSTLFLYHVMLGLLFWICRWRFYKTPVCLQPSSIQPYRQTINLMWKVHNMV